MEMDAEVSSKCGQKEQGRSYFVRCHLYVLSSRDGRHLVLRYLKSLLVVIGLSQAYLQAGPEMSH